MIYLIKVKKKHSLHFYYDFKWKGIVFYETVDLYLYGAFGSALSLRRHSRGRFG